MQIVSTDINALIQRDLLESELEKQKAITEYIAMMADVEIPIEEEENYEQNV